MDINNFGPVNAEVWGTVSDWVMVGVTGLTAFFLWKTLKSQLKVQEAQLKITQIENQRFIMDQKLQFDIDIIKKEIYQQGDEIISGVFDLEFLLQNSNCLICEIEIDSKNTNLTIAANQVLKFDELIKESILPVHFISEMPRGQYENEEGNILITVRFVDYIGNKYKQNAEIRFKQGLAGITVMPSPIIVPTN